MTFSRLPRIILEVQRIKQISNKKNPGNSREDLGKSLEKTKMSQENSRRHHYTQVRACSCYNAYELRLSN